VLLRREGHAVNRKRVQRSTARAADGAPARRPQAGDGTRRPMVTPLAPDQRWSLDFVSDQLPTVGVSAS